MPAEVDKEKCDGCQSCQEACPSEAIEILNSKAVVNADDCIDCNACEDACPKQAISMK